MSPELYASRMAEMGISREGLEFGIEPFDSSTVNAVKEPTYLNEKASMVPLLPGNGGRLRRAAGMGRPRK